MTCEHRGDVRRELQDVERRPRPDVDQEADHALMSDIDRPDAWVVLPPAEILATVDVAAVPQIPFASIRSALIPVRDDNGVLVDWHLSATAMDEPETIAEFWAWRRRWRSSWPIGPVSNIAALIRTADEMGHYLGDELGALLEQLVDAEAGEVICPGEQADDVLQQLEALRLALIDTIEAGPGAGIVDETPGPGRQLGLSRAWVADDTEHVLAATATTAVVVRPGDGLVLLYDGPKFRSLPWLTEVDLLSDPVVVADDQGERVELTPDEARPLAWLVPRALRWHVRTVPLVTVWTQLLTGLPDALTTAAAAGTDVRFTTELAMR